MKNVLIIGNGFDLDLGLPTRYSDFAKSEYWPKLDRVPDRRSIFSIAEGKQYQALGLSLLGKSITENWFDLEEALLDYVTNEVAHLEHDLYCPQDDNDYYQVLQSKLCDYLIDVQNNKPVNKLSIAGKVLKAVLENGNYDNIFSFNYTDLNFLAKQLGIEQGIQYTHLHGKLSDRSIILGVDGRKLTPGYEPFHKTASPFYRSHSLPDAIEEANDIVFFGFAFGEIDWGYFDEFFRKILNGATSNGRKNCITIFTKNRASEIEIKNKLGNHNIDVGQLYSKTHLQFIHCEDDNSDAGVIDFLNRQKANKKKKSMCIKTFIRKLFLSICFCAMCIIGNAQTTIQMEKVGGVYKIPCTVNGLRLKMIFDSGASNVCISESTARMMLENDYLSVEDIKGNGKSTMADGRIVDHTEIILKKVQIGDKVLTNVEAVVVHGQDAPLLFGQTALKRLGCYTISGNTLIIGTGMKPVNETDGLNLTDDDVDSLFREAANAYDKEAYSIALDKFRILYEHDVMTANGIMLYADCYFYTEQDEKALVLYASIEKDIALDFPNEKTHLNLQIGRCLINLEDYDAAVPYLESVKYYAEQFSWEQWLAVHCLSVAYKKNRDDYSAKRVVDNYIFDYLSYKNITPTDCWTKGLHDEFLADLYRMRRNAYTTFDEYDWDKYCIISAAWGDKKSIEDCKKYQLEYSKMPSDYVY